MTKKAILGVCLTAIFALSMMSGIVTIGTGDGIVNKYAIIIGISDYDVINDLSYCDEDATDWYNYLVTMDYQITLFGDNHPENYPKYDGLATEHNVKEALENILSVADEDDIVVFASSGHGGRVRNKDLKAFDYYLCMWDTSNGQEGENGLISQYEIKEMFAPSLAKTFIFLDHCYAGGFATVMENDNSANIYMALTCTDKGSGFDDPVHLNGMWTYWFLEYTLIGEFGGTASMEETFAFAHAIYLDEMFRPIDEPMEFDGTPEIPFYL